jgi:RNA polymerase sigma factor (sigma-70 family)
MQTRLGIIEIFSTFVQFHGDSFSGWMTDSALRRSIKYRMEHSSQKESDKDSFWALYWYKVWQNQGSPVAAAHISAYLQEVCYWVAKKIAMNFSSQSSVADCFQMAIFRVTKILSKFNLKYSSNLKAYAELAFESYLKDSLRLRHEIDICTDWALLHKISRKRLINSLKNSGFNSLIIESYVLAWECFKELYIGNDGTKIRKLVKPDVLVWQAITNLYNVQRISQLNDSTTTATTEMLEEYLSRCAKAIRGFISPNIISIDTPRNEQQEGSLLDAIPASIDESLLTEIIAQEEFVTTQQHIAQLREVIHQAIAHFDQQSQQILQTYYSKQLTQQEIAQELGIQQYQVSRRLSSIKRSLLKSLAQWSHDTLHISPTPDVLDAMSINLEEYLKKYGVADLPPKSPNSGGL